MCVAPARRAAMTIIAPIGPQPVTSTCLPSSEPGAAHRVQRHRQRLGHRAFAVAHAVGQPIGLRGVDDDLLAERALHMRRAHRAAVVAHVQAMVLQALLAVAAQAAGAARADRDALAGQRSRRRPVPTASITPATSWPSTIGSLMRTVPKPPCW